MKKWSLFTFSRFQKDRNQFAQTPDELYQDLSETFGPFDFDPCPVDPTFDGLSVEWGAKNYVNPPFNNLRAWLTKAVEEWSKGKEVVFLTPIRIHTKYFQELVLPLADQGNVQLYVLTNGVKFKGYKEKAPFGVMFVYFHHNVPPLPQ